MADNGNGGPLSGDVEIDEVYVGGKPRNAAKASPLLRRSLIGIHHAVSRAHLGRYVA